MIIFFFFSFLKSPLAFHFPCRPPSVATGRRRAPGCVPAFLPSLWRSFAGQPVLLHVAGHGKNASLLHLLKPMKTVLSLPFTSCCTRRKTRRKQQGRNGDWPSVCARGEKHSSPVASCGGRCRCRSPGPVPVQLVLLLDAQRVDAGLLECLFSHGGKSELM